MCAAFSLIRGRADDYFYLYSISNLYVLYNISNKHYTWHCIMNIKVTFWKEKKEVNFSDLFDILN